MTEMPSEFDDLPRPVVLVDPDSQSVLSGNIAAQELFGKSAKGLTKHTLGTLLPAITDSADLVGKVVTGNAPMELLDIKLGEGSATVSLFPSGQAVGVMILPDRATAGRQLEGRSIHSLGQMMGHELKNPLAGIKGAAQLLRTDVSDPESHALLDLISSEIDRIRRLAERLQTFGDSDTARSRVNVHTVLRNARKLMAPTAGQVFFTEDYDPSLPHIQGDTDMIMQAVVNLIKNAVEALGDEGGEITLKTRSRSGVRRGGASLPIELQIIDNGPGLPKAMRDRLFEPFVTSKPSGQGLGLALVAKVIGSHDGIVEVDSRPGRTKFSILLPAAPEIVSTNEDIRHGS